MSRTRLAVEMSFIAEVRIEEVWVVTNYDNIECTADENEVVKTEVSDFSDEELKSIIVTLIRGKVLNGFDEEALTLEEIAGLILKDYKDNGIRRYYGRDIDVPWSRHTWT